MGVSTKEREFVISPRCFGKTSSCVILFFQHSEDYKTWICFHTKDNEILKVLSKHD